VRLKTEPSPRQSGVVQSFDGTTVHYDYYPSTSPNLVLVVPGFWRSRQWPSMYLLAGLLNRLGYAAAIVDVRGHGDSGGVYGFNLYEHEDVYAVARQLCDTRHPESVAMLGFSVGGAIAVSTASLHSDLPWSSLLLVSPVAEFGKIVPRLNPFTMHRHLSLRNALRRPRFDWGFLRSPKHNVMEEIAGVHVPVAFIHVNNDWLVHHRHSLQLYDRANDPKELHILDIRGRHHADALLRVAPDRLEQLAGDFLLRTCRTKEKAALSRGF
jgi:pimeloyl-ACP methyl ester carboxylesterase